MAEFSKMKILKFSEKWIPEKFSLFFKSKSDPSRRQFLALFSKKPKLWTRSSHLSPDLKSSGQPRESRPQFLPPTWTQAGAKKTPKMGLINFPIFEPYFPELKFWKILALVWARPRTFGLDLAPDPLRRQFLARKSPGFSFMKILGLAAKSGQNLARSWARPGPKMSPKAIFFSKNH